MTESPGTWDGGWQANAARQRSARALLTPSQRMEWLEQMVELLAESGMLADDRARRTRETSALWNTSGR